MAFLALLIRCTSRGPAIYRQVRLGWGDRPFTLYKLRTMQHDCEKLTGPCWAVPNDPRVTRIGRCLRATHMDELPQLWNVLRGEMSLIGPRPERPEIIVNLESFLIPRYAEHACISPRPYRPGPTTASTRYRLLVRSAEARLRFALCRACLVCSRLSNPAGNSLQGLRSVLPGHSTHFNGRQSRRRTGKTGHGVRQRLTRCYAHHAAGQEFNDLRIRAEIS